MKVRTDNQGAIAIVTLLTIAVFALAVMVTMSVLTVEEAHMGSSEVAAEKTFYAAEAGINEALLRISNNPAPDSFQLPLSMTDGVDVQVQISPNPSDPYQRIVTSTAEDVTGKRRTLEIMVNATSYAGSFNYAIQSGQGGFKMDNATVIGDIFSNGSIDATNSSQILGNTWVAIEGTFSYPHRDNIPTTARAFGRNAGDKVTAQSFSAAADTPIKRIRVYLRKQSNPNNNITLRLVPDNGANEPGEQVISQATISKNDVNSTFSWMEVSFPIPPLLIAGKTYWLTLDANGVNATKYYEWDFDTNAAGFPGEARQTSDFSSGTWTSISGDFAFQSVGIGATSVSNVTIGTSSEPKDLHTLNITNGSEIWGDAYYSSKDSASTVHGSSNPATNDQPKSFPMDGDDLTNWKNVAAAGGELVPGDVDAYDAGTNSYIITSPRSFGPKKVNGNLILDNGANLTLTGNVWVTGNIEMRHTNIKIHLADSYGSLSGVLVADGQILDQNLSDIYGSCNPEEYPDNIICKKSFLLLISTFNFIDASAINTSNNSRSALYYAPYGIIHLDQNAGLNSALAYYIDMEQSSSVEYNSNLQGFVLPPEPGRVFGVESGTWEEN